MGILAWLILGAVAGILAGRLMGERTGLLMAIIVGIVGALLGGFLAKAIFHVQTLNAFFNASTWATAIVGSVLFLGVVRLLRGGGRRGVRW